ncbi:MAG: alpha/beta fold hydrolase [Rhizobiales bacterium]|nr:alpha/beta fold hydrolase [Hyphomicrobiales bacterium]
MTDITALFPGFEERTVRLPGAEIFYRIAGSGRPLVLLHGYPQTHAIWHRIAGPLAERFTLVLPDLRGYGRSRGPAADPAHENYSKRAMAGDILALMRSLGHERFAVGGHDRGGRVAYRLALDQPDAVTHLIAVDILPTLEIWEAMDADAAISAYHWPFLSQPHPLPETLIAGAPEYYVDHTLASWAGTRDLSPFSPEALADYRALLTSPHGRTAVAEDYRAGATYDRAADREDRASGRRITAPMLVLWGEDYVGAGKTSPIDIWRRWAADVTGVAIPCGHFLAEEAPERTLGAMLAFLEDRPEVPQ